MLNPEQLKLAIDVHARCYKLLKWISAAIADGRIPVRNASRHSDDPSAALEWIESIESWAAQRPAIEIERVTTGSKRALNIERASVLVEDGVVARYR